MPTAYAKTSAPETRVDDGLVGREPAFRDWRVLEKAILDRAGRTIGLNRAAAVGVNGSWVVGGCTGAVISLFALMDFLLRPRTVDLTAGFGQMREASPIHAAALIAVALATGVPMLAGAVVLGVDFRRARYLLPVALLVCLSIPLSFLMVTDATQFLYIPLVFSIFAYLIIGASANVVSEDFLRGLGVGLVLTLSAIFLWVFVDRDEQWGRLCGRNASNYWGAAAQAVLFGCIVARGRLVRIAAVVICVIMLFWTQSRGSMLAAGAGLTVAFMLYMTVARGRLWLCLLIATALVLAFAFGSGFILDKVLMLSDPARGLTSGFTGRTAAWRETIDLFAAHPIFGVGFRQHEQYLTSAVSAHNAYLATLADTGVVGALSYCLFLFGGLAIALRKALRDPSAGRIMMAGFLTAYIVNGVFERSALNTGNTYSMVMILLCAWSWRDDLQLPEPWTFARRRVGA